MSLFLEQTHLSAYSSDTHSSRSRDLHSFFLQRPRSSLFLFGHGEASAAGGNLGTLAHNLKYLQAPSAGPAHQLDTPSASQAVSRAKGEQQDGAGSTCLVPRSPQSSNFDLSSGLKSQEMLESIQDEKSPRTESLGNIQRAGSWA